MLVTELGRPGLEVPRGARGLALLSRASEGLQRARRALFRAARPRRRVIIQPCERLLYCCLGPREYGNFDSDSQLGTE